MGTHQHDRASPSEEIRSLTAEEMDAVGGGESMVCKGYGGSPTVAAFIDGFIKGGGEMPATYWAACLGEGQEGWL